MSADPDDFPEFLARYARVERLTNLAHNLATAGALEEAFRAGEMEGYHRGYRNGRESLEGAP